MNARRVARYLCWGLCLAVLAAQALTTARHYVELLRGGRHVLSAGPAPRYGYMRVPDVAGGPPALGADFSQVYFAALALRHGDNPYAPRDPAFRDRFSRRPNYPPLTNHLYLPLAGLAYRDAIVVHSLATLALFVGVTVVVLGALGLGRHALGACLACLLLGYLTPIGLSHFERGQFDLVVAASFLLAVASVYARRADLAMAAVGAGLGGLKWTAGPFLGLFSLLGFVVAPTARRRLVFVVVPLVLLLTVVPFVSEIQDYWPSLRQYELDASPKGVTLQRLLPRVGAQALPILCTLLFLGLFAIRSRRGWDRLGALRAVALPFALALALQTLCVVTVAYEYRLVSLLGLLPAAVIWLERAEGVSRVMRVAVAGLLGAFLVIAFRVFDFRVLWLDLDQMLFLYLASSAGFLAMAVHVLWSLPAPTGESREPAALV